MDDAPILTPLPPATAPLPTPAPALTPDVPSPTPTPPTTPGSPVSEIGPLPPQVLPVLNNLKSNSSISEDLADLLLEFKDLVGVDGKGISNLYNKHKEKIALFGAHAVPVVKRLFNKNETVSAIEVLKLLPEAIFLLSELSPELAELAKENQPILKRLWTTTTSLARKAWARLMKAKEWAEQKIFGRKKHANSVEIIMSSWTLTMKQQRQGFIVESRKR